MVELGHIGRVHRGEGAVLVVLVLGLRVFKVQPGHALVPHGHAGVQAAPELADHDVGGAHLVEEGGEAAEVVPTVQHERGFEEQRDPGGQVAAQLHLTGRIELAEVAGGLHLVGRPSEEVVLESHHAGVHRAGTEHAPEPHFQVLLPLHRQRQVIVTPVGTVGGHGVEVGDVVVRGKPEVSGFQGLPVQRSPPDAEHLVREDVLLPCQSMEGHFAHAEIGHSGPPPVATRMYILLMHMPARGGKDLGHAGHRGIVAVLDDAIDLGEIKEGGEGLRLDHDAVLALHAVVGALLHHGPQLAQQVVLAGWWCVVPHVAADDQVRQEGVVHHVAGEVVVEPAVHHQVTVHADGLEVEGIAHAGPHHLGQIALIEGDRDLGGDVRGHAPEGHEEAVQVATAQGRGPREPAHLLEIQQQGGPQVGGQGGLQRGVQVETQVDQRCVRTVLLEGVNEAVLDAPLRHGLEGL